MRKIADVVEEFKRDGKPIRINLGCGPYCPDGWINTDVYDVRTEGTIEMNATEIPLSANVVDELSACHLIEHLDYFEGHNAIKEWYRVLKPGGKLTIETPDFLELCKKFIDANEQERIRLYDYFFSQPWIPYNLHKFLYTEIQLIWTLQHHNFKSAVRVIADSHFVEKGNEKMYLKVEAYK